MPKLILSYRLWEEDGNMLFQVTGMDEAFRGKGKLFERKYTAVYSFDLDRSIPHVVTHRKHLIKTLNAWARSLNPAIQKETDFTKTEFAYYYAEDDKPKCHWCGSDMESSGGNGFTPCYLLCSNMKCRASSPDAPTEADAIAKHNQIKR